MIFGIVQDTGLKQYVFIALNLTQILVFNSGQNVLLLPPLTLLSILTGGLHLTALHSQVARLIHETGLLI